MSTLLPRAFVGCILVLLAALGCRSTDAILADDHGGVEMAIDVFGNRSICEAVASSTKIEVYELVRHDVYVADSDARKYLYRYTIAHGPRHLASKQAQSLRQMLVARDSYRPPDYRMYLGTLTWRWMVSFPGPDRRVDMLITEEGIVHTLENGVLVGGDCLTGPNSRRMPFFAE